MNDSDTTTHRVVDRDDPTGPSWTDRRDAVALRARRLAWEFRAHKHLLLLAGIYVITATIYLLITGQTRFLELHLYLTSDVHLIILALIVCRIAFGVGYRWIRYGREAVRPFWTEWERRITRGVPAILALTLVLSTYSSVKGTLLKVIPNTIDAELANVDRLLHGGVDAWAVLQPILGEPLITHFIDVSYFLWMFVMILVTYWQVFQGNDLRGRYQYLMTAALSWALLGNAIAALLMSGGPVYFDELTGDTQRYGALFAYLQNVDVIALDVQNRLWNWHVSGLQGEYRGISAMPSVHVALAVSMALVGWRRNALMGSLLTVYATVILVGSVHLGWHYAIDGYVSIVLVAVIWWIAGQWYDATKAKSVRPC